MKTFFKTFFIGALILFLLFVALGLYFSNAPEKEVTRYNIQQNALFSENLAYDIDYAKFDHENDYKHLAKKLNYLYAVRTVDYEFQFREKMQKLHVFPLENGNYNSEKRQIYDIKPFGYLKRGLSFTIEGKNKGELVLQSDNKTTSLDRVLVVKFKVNNDTYCKRGVVYHTMDHKGDTY